jgi:hypothetical protein
MVVFGLIVLFAFEAETEGDEVAENDTSLLSSFGSLAMLLLLLRLLLLVLFFVFFLFPLSVGIVFIQHQPKHVCGYTYFRTSVQPKSSQVLGT